MSNEREERLLRQVDAELQEALDVAPSPEFLSRVRERVAGEASAGRAWALPWLMPVAAGLVALIATVSLRQPAPTASPAVTEAPRPFPEARVSVPEPPAGPLVHRPRPERAKAEPEVLVTPGAEELLRSFVAGIQTGRVDATALAAGEANPPDLAIAPLGEIPSLELKPLTSGTDSEGVDQ